MVSGYIILALLIIITLLFGAVTIMAVYIRNLKKVQNFTQKASSPFQKIGAAFSL